jgi:hypothetical protein
MMVGLGAPSASQRLSRRAALRDLLLDTLTLHIASQTTPMLDEGVFETHRGTRTMHISSIGQIDYIMNEGQGRMQP